LETIFRIDEIWRPACSQGYGNRTPAIIGMGETMANATRLIIVFAVAGLTLLAASDSNAQQSSLTSSSSIAATVVSPISVSTTTDLSFGVVIASGVPGTVTVTPAGARSASGGATLGSAATVSPAIFTVTGDANNSYSITLPASGLVTCGATSMVVDSFTSTPTPTGDLGPGGSQTLTVGASLQVNNSQTICTYSGSVDVTVAYN